MSHETEQELFWQGSFGEQYTARNSGEELLASNRRLFAKFLDSVGPISSICELGANKGLNLRALKDFLPNATMTGLEINQYAYEQLNSLDYVNAVHGSILSTEFSQSFDLVFTKGVLIHLPPEHLTEVYRKIADLTTKYALFIEYFNPAPTEIPYRGYRQKLFKRDFAGEFLDISPRFRIRDYGFVWRRDPLFPQDDLNWFLMEKS